ncbi:MAG TPA: hypothetical protein PLU35_13420, partial [Phycisphaerales bacterium]|nr:hypothetical protein [Phycisphaerales bacterium]
MELTQDCFLSPGEFLAAYNEWHEKQIDPECNSDYDEPLTPCELAQEYIDLVEDFLGAPLSDEQKCRIRVAFRCPDDCGGGGGDFYPPWDPINPIGPPWVSVSNPFPGPATTPPSIGSVDLARGAYRPREVDLSLPSPGFSWVIGRGYAVDPDDPQSPVDSYQGYNWAQISHPMITEPETITSGVFIGLRTVTILYERIGRMGFIESSAGSGIFIGTEGTRGVVVEIPADGDDPEMYKLYTQNGTITTFFGFDVNAAGAEGQLWKHVDVAGNTAWVGHPDEADTAVTNGYADGRMLYAVDPGDRRYVYTYSGSEIGGLKRLIEVEAQTKTGGAWEGTPSGVSEVARVEYGFYEEDEEDLGLEGDLKLVTVVMPTSVSGVSTQTQRYYRYYAGQSRALSDLPDFIKMVVGSEGLRRVGSVFETESDGDLKPYAEMYFEYFSSSDGRIESFFQNGDCGCAGGSGVDGTIELSYDENPAFEEEDGFQDEWRYRTVVAFPDGLYVTHYVDELFKPWAEVRTDDDPAETAPVPSAWVTRFVRDPDTAETVKIVTPSAVSSYTHNDGSNDPLGTIVTSTTDGLVRLFEYSLEDDIFGHLIHTKWRVSDHAEADAFLLSTTRYDARVLEVATDDNGLDLDDYTATVARSFVAESWAYTVAGTDVSVIGDPADGSYLTQFDYEAFYNDTATEPDFLAPKVVTTIYATVSTGKNGSGTSEAESRFLLADGRVQFTKDVDGVIGYTAYDAATGLPITVAADADTTLSGSGEIFNGVTIPDAPVDFSASGDPLHQVTAFTYDAQGRLATTTLHAHSTTASRVAEQVYTRLDDGRFVTLSIPRYDAGAGKRYGPVAYTVRNHAGRTEAGGVIALAAGGEASAPTTWIDDEEDDPITAVQVGTLARYSTSEYGETGTRLLRSLTYHAIPGSGDGTEGTNYDAVPYAYDNSGRLVRTKDATGTVSRTAYDVLGRPAARSIGTNDNGEVGGDTSGTNDMVATEVYEYDGGLDGGNSYLTEVTRYVVDGTTGQRVTAFENDVRGRAVLVENPLAPHVLTKYDNVGRATAVATYRSASGLSASSDPFSATSNRLSLSETRYDERGQVFEAREYRIDQSTGGIVQTLSSDTYLIRSFWYDGEGRAVKTHGERFEKWAYDRLGRPTHSFVISSTNDTTYAHALDVAGDVVLEESQTAYDPETGNVLMTAVVGRLHGDYGVGQTTGALDTNADGDPLTITAANLEGRVQITAFWYDALDRLTDTVAFGTYGGSDFEREGMSVPARSATALRTTVTYDTDGSVLEVEDPAGITTRYLYDEAGRTVATIANHTGGSLAEPVRDHDVYTRFEYQNGLQVKMWVDLDGDGVEDAGDDQVTTYTYGVSPGDDPGPSAVAAGHLLRQVTYPDSASGSDVVRFAYNAQGEQVWTRDQAGNVVESDYDELGRLTHRRATTIAGGFDDAVKRISTAYDARGLATTVT